MSRIYTVTLNGTITNAGGDTDLLELSPADDAPCLIRGMILSQVSELGDAAEENLRIDIIRGYTSSGSGGGAGTAVPVDGADPAASFACEVNNTTVATTGTAVTIDSFAWNVRMSPFERWWPDPQFAPKVRQSNTTMVVRCASTVVDDITFTMTVYIEEV